MIGGAAPGRVTGSVALSSAGSYEVTGLVPGRYRAIATAGGFTRPPVPTLLRAGDEPVVIPDGMRAVSVKVDEVIGVAGFVLPGTRVDVLATFGDRDAAITRVILQNVEALAAGQTTQPDAQGKPQTVPVITLLVSPEEAEDLTLAATQGQIQLALRGTLDQQSVRTDGSRVGGLVRGATAEPVRRVAASTAPRSPAQRVITYNGAEKTVAEF